MPPRTAASLLRNPKTKRPTHCTQWSMGPARRQSSCQADNLRFPGCCISVVRPAPADLKAGATSRCVRSYGLEIAPKAGHEKSNLRIDIFSSTSWGAGGLCADFIRLPNRSTAGTESLLGPISARARL